VHGLNWSAAAALMVKMPLAMGQAMVLSQSANVFISN
jgi:hypothetical protein